VLQGTDHVEWLRNSQSFQARIWMLQRRYEEVEQWLVGLPRFADAESPLVLESLAITRVRALLLRPTPERLAEANESLDRLDRMVGGTALAHLRDAALVCRAVLRDRQGNRRAALRMLRQALVGMTERDDVLAVAEYGGRVATMVGVLAGRGEADPAFAARVASVAAAIDARTPDPLALTDRETLVMAGLAEGRSLVDIAAATGMSASTARSHATRAYAKLGADSRQQAIARARALGLVG